MRKNSARKVALLAVSAAFSTAFLYLASLFPTGQLGFLGLASLFGIAAVMECGLPGGLAVWAVTALLGLLLVPYKALAGLYAVFFGPYPVVKALAERGNRVLEWVIKVLFFNAALTVAIFALKVTLFDFTKLQYSVPVLYATGNLVFVIFDIAVSRAIAFYMARIHPRIHK